MQPFLIPKKLGRLMVIRDLSNCLICKEKEFIHVKCIFYLFSNFTLCK